MAKNTSKKPVLGLGSGSPAREAAIARLVASLEPVKISVSLRVQ